MNTPERNGRIQDICERALEQDAPVRAAFVRDLCADDEGLRRDVESLLRHADAAPSFMESPSIESLAWPGASAERNEPLSPGTRIGQYEVVARIGTGGMGEVYRAHDTRLGRDIAIKILPNHLLPDGDSRERFDREARMLAALNHPHIGAIYGVEDSDSGPALILELVEGETLATRIARSWRRHAGLPWTDALTIAGQIAEALEGAHEKGIIHRDLKPANVQVMTDGTVKVLDFGVAKLMLPSSGATPRGGHATFPGATHDGVIVGTPRYMSPEQVRGEPVDKRADIWAFGCVLYEMLTGGVAFPGETTSDTLVAILEREPDWSALPAATPATIRRLLSRCLQKDPKKRLRDIGDARIEIEDAHAGHAATSGLQARRIPWRWLAACLGAAVLAAASVWTATSTRPGPSPRVTRFSLTAPTLGYGASARNLTIAANGSRLLYTSPEGFVIRALDRIDEHVMQGYGGNPFFSPDGEWIGHSGDSLQRVPTAGGAPVVVAAAAHGAVASWRGNEIVFANVNGLFRVPAAGGTPEKLPLRGLAAAEQASFPEMLPGGRAVLFTVIPTRAIAVGSSGNVLESRIEILSLDSGARRVIVRGASRAQYVPTGHLVYAASGSLYAVPFDLTRLDVRGEPVQVVAGSSEFAVADNGTLTYVADGKSGLSRLVWVDRRGREEQLDAQPRPYLYPRLSPDGMRVAVDVGPPNRDIWMLDLERGQDERFTTDPASNPLVAWSRDGTSVAFGSDRFGATSMFVQPADGSSEARRLLVSDRVQMPVEFAPDGRLLFVEVVPDQGDDILALTLDGSARTESIVHGPGNEGNPTVSPDGGWIAYESDESGQYEVYVRPYRDPDRARSTVSVNGGRQPLWSRDGHELFYRDFSGAVMSAAVTRTPSFGLGRAARVIDGSAYTGSGSRRSGRHYDLSLDGRFLMIRPVEAARPSSVEVVLNWFTELRRLVPIG